MKAGVFPPKRRYFYSLGYFKGQTMRRILALLSLVLIAACQSAPLYQEAAVLGQEGFFDQELEEDRYQVSFTGRPGARADAVRDFAFLRAAEITLRQEADWFEVVQDEPVSTVDADFIANLADTGPGVTQDCGVLGCRDVIVSERPFGAAADRTRARAVNGHTLEIIVHKGEIPDDAANAYEAKKLSLEMFDRYELYR